MSKKKASLAPAEVKEPGKARKTQVKKPLAIKTEIKAPEFIAHQFRPGQSGNPSGRPKADKTVKALAREHTAAAIRTLAEILNNNGASESSRVQAASALLDRGWGKPLQQLEVGEAGAFSEMDEDAIDAFIASAMLRLRDANVAGHA